MWCNLLPFTMLFCQRMVSLDTVSQLIQCQAQDASVLGLLFWTFLTRTHKLHINLAAGDISIFSRRSNTDKGTFQGALACDHTQIYSLPHQWGLVYFDKGSIFTHIFIIHLGSHSHLLVCWLFSLDFRPLVQGKYMTRCVPSCMFQQILSCSHLCQSADSSILAES